MNQNKGFTLIEILVVIGIIALLAAVVLIAINPARQFAQGRNSQRTSNVNAILNAVGQYIADNKGEIPGAATNEITAADQGLSAGGADICSFLVPKYLSALPVDPGTDPDGSSNPLKKGEALKNCSTSSYDTGYHIFSDSSSRITVKAPATELQSEGVAVIETTR